MEPESLLLLLLSIYAYACVPGWRHLDLLSLLVSHAVKSIICSTESMDSVGNGDCSDDSDGIC